MDVGRSPAVSTYVVFLRAVNVGTRQVRMAELRDWLTLAGYTEVETYIQTGNVRLRSSARSTAKVAADLESLLANRCGFEVPCIVLTPAELAAAYAEATSYRHHAERQYVSFFTEPIPADRAAELDAWDVPGERLQASGRLLHWWLEVSPARSKISNARAERGGLVCTTRDLKVVAALTDRWT